MKRTARGSGWQDGKRASNPSSILPRALQSFVVRNNLRPVETDVKSAATRCCGRERTEHNIQRKYSQNQEVRSTVRRGDFVWFSAVIPPVLRRLSTVFCTVFSGVIRRKSTSFPHVLHTIFVHNSPTVFPQDLRCDSEGNSRLGRKKSGRRH